MDDSAFVITSSSGRDWNLPSDYNLSHTWILGWLDLEVGGELRHFLYSGTRDTMICHDASNWDEGTGKGVAVAELVRRCEGFFCDDFDSGAVHAWSEAVGFVRNF